MFTLLNERKTILKEQKQSKAMWTQQLEKYEEKRRELQAKKDQIEDEIYTQKNKKYKLKRKSLAYFIAKLTKQMEAKTQQIEEELLSLEKVREDLQLDLREVLNDMEEVRNQLAALPNFDAVYDEIFAKQAAYIEAQDIPLGRKYRELDGKIQALQLFLQRSEDAMQLGKKAEEEFETAKRLLKKAEKWGALDILGGSGYAGHKKHEYVKEAHAHAQSAQSKRKLMEHTFSQMRHENDISLQIDEAFVFLDLASDGLYINLLVQEKVEESMRQVDVQMNEIQKLLNQLSFRHQQKKQAMDAFIEEREILLKEIESIVEKESNLIE